MHAASGETQRSRRTILLAEDSPGDVALLREAFRVHAPGLSMEHAADGESALRRLLRGDAPRIDLLLLDLNLPRLDGRAVLARLRELPRHVPTVVLTGSLRRADRAECLRLGAVHFAIKPSYFGEWLRLADFVAGHLRHLDASERNDPHTPTPLGSATLV